MIFGNIPAKTVTTQKAIARAIKMNALPDAFFMLKSTEIIILTAVNAQVAIEILDSSKEVDAKAHTTHNTVTTIAASPNFGAKAWVLSKTA